MQCGLIRTLVDYYLQLLYLTRERQFSNCVFREAQDRDHRVIGTFIPGENAPSDIQEMQSNFMDPNFHVQVYLEFDRIFIQKDRRNIWLQYLLDCPLKVLGLSDHLVPESHFGSPSKNVI